MARKLKSDKVLFVVTLLLLLASVVMVYSASAAIAAERYKDASLFLKKQVMWAALGLGCLGLAMRLDYRAYRQPGIVWGVLAASLLALVAVLFSDPINGTRRWFGVGGVGIQPSEVAKLAVIFFTAAVLERRMHRIDDIRYSLLPVAIVVAAVVVLVLLEPDFGTAASILAVAGLMVFAAGLHWRYIAFAATAVVPLAAVVIMSADYRVRRLTAFWNPEADPLGDGYQVLQSLMAVGTGGPFGRGLGAGLQKLFYLPEPHTDFIYAVIGEEVGLLGTTLVLLAFAVIAWRGLRIAKSLPDGFGSLLAIGITGMIVVQAFINISVVLGMLPTKGITLPLVSSGGSSLVINLVAMGILLNLSQHASPLHEA